METIYFGSDHAGFEMKSLLIRNLRESGLSAEDCGTNSRDSCDYPVFASSLCKLVLASGGKGVLICGTGIGMSMAANRTRGIRAALCATEIQARLARNHNNANVLCLGARIIGPELALAITKAFLESSFDGGRHQRRIDLFDWPGCKA